MQAHAYCRIHSESAIVPTRINDLLSNRKRPEAEEEKSLDRIQGADWLDQLPGEQVLIGFNQKFCMAR
jgi:hypothetical protein